MSAMHTILVTGTSSGFGRLISLTLCRAGYRVFAGMRDVAGRNAPAAAALRAEAREGAHDLEVIDLDVTRDDSVAAAVDAVLARGSLDALVNNAGVAAAGLVETFSPEQAQRLYDVNVCGPLRMARAALPSMRARGSGLMVYLSSTYGREIGPFLGPYVATKFALEALAESLRYETSPLGVDTVIVQPGTFPTTGILRNLIAPAEPERAAGYGFVSEMPGKVFAGLDALVRSGRAPDPQLVADAVLSAVKAPHGARPARVVVDPQGLGGAAELNALSERVQQRLLMQYGAGALLGARHER